MDNSMANTFDNKTYPIDLGNCWHVMMKLVPKVGADVTYSRSSRHFPRTLGTLDPVTVLVKEVGKNKASITYSQHDK
jgi:hypothetical protein